MQPGAIDFRPGSLVDDSAENNGTAGMQVDGDAGPRLVGRDGDGLAPLLAVHGVRSLH